MKKSRKRVKFMETRVFGLIIGIFIIFLFLGIGEYTGIFKNMEIKVLDLHFRFKDISHREAVQEGVSVVRANPNISPDILIVGIDFRALTRFGKWPFPRYVHSHLVNNFTYILNQNERERSIMLDLFFVEPDENAVNDGLLIESLRDSERVFLETILDESPPPSQEMDQLIDRQKTLIETHGAILNVKGDWDKMVFFPGVQPPLKPYGRASAGYGHANYFSDPDDIYRRQPMIAKLSIEIEEIPLDDFTVDYPLDRGSFQRFGWNDREGRYYTIPYPLTARALSDLRKEIEAKAPPRRIDTTGDGNPDTSYFVVRKYQDYFIPSITLSLALDYFNKTYDDIEVVLDDSIVIPSPEYFDISLGTWVPYELTVKEAVYNSEGEIVTPEERRVVPEIRIPIDDQANMLVNYMGPPSMTGPGERQTFPVRSYAGYASSPPSMDPDFWPRTRAVGNKIILVGAFAQGMAADHKPTPYGLMYGIEIHANALNTILMNKFIYEIPGWVNVLILTIMVMLIAFLASRLSTVWAFLAAMFIILALFLTSSIVFDRYAQIIAFSSPALATFFTFLSVVVYRAMTEEKDKKRIRSMFSTYVSPKVVDQILENPPELGGLDKELTVFFSDIRGFTTISESMTPQELVKILNRYLTAMTDIILEFDGTLDKYEGDAIMAFWGAPAAQEDHALRACICSLKQLEALKTLNEDLPEGKKLDIGIGINSGIMTVGNMGSLQRMDYTLIGDNVNLGARLEGTNKQYMTKIIISENTYGLVKDHVIVRELDNIRVKGKNKPVLIYELIDYIRKDETPAAEGKGNKKPDAVS